MELLPTVATARPGASRLKMTNVSGASPPVVLLEPLIFLMITLF